MGCTSRIRPRPWLWSFGGIRFILSATAFVRSGLHIRTEAFAPTLLASCPGETLHPSSFCPATRSSTSQGPQGPSSVTRTSSARSGSAWDGRGHQRDSANGRTALDAIGTVFAATNDVSIRDEKLSRRAAGNNVNRATKFALGRTTAQPMTVLEEAALVGEVKTLAGYLKTRDNLTAELGRTPSHEEWATSVGLTFDELSVQMKASHHAQERIVEANTGLIVMMARRYHPFAFHQGTIANDLIQEGSLALLRAAETFNPHLGYRFSTYAGWWVRDRVQRCVVDQARLIRLPRHVHNFRRAIAKTEVLLLKEFARPPTPEETAERMQVDVARVIRYSNCPETFSLDDVAFASSSNGRFGGGRSIGRGPGKSAGAGYRHEKVACSMISPEKRAEVFLFQAKLDQLMSVLSPDERLVVSLRYGLGGASPVTLNEMAEKAGSTKHRVRMVETRALNKLRCRPEPRQYGRAGSVLVADGERDTVKAANDPVNGF